MSHRKRLPDERQAVTHRFQIGEVTGYLTVGLYDDGTPGELFVVVSKAGSTINGLVDSFAVLFSFSLQYGVPLRDLVDKLSHTRFEPSGRTRNKDIPEASSIIDYVARWMEARFLSRSAAPPPNTPSVPPPSSNSSAIETPVTFTNSEDAPACVQCGAIMVRSGTCYRCLNCGSTSGCS